MTDGVWMRQRQADRRSVSAAPSYWAKALLLGVQLVRLLFTLAELRAFISACSERAVMPEPLVCRYPECERTRAEKDPDYCLQHAYATNAQAARLVVETTNYLSLEAQFDAWCTEHGLPDPHEK